MSDPIAPTAPAAESVAASEFFERTAPELPAAETPPPPAAPVTPPPAPAVDAFAGQKDSRGVEWNPVKFRLKDGKPHTDKLGRYVPAGIGRGGFAATEPGATPPPAPGGGFARSTLPPDDAAATLDAAQPMPADVTVDVAIGLVQAALIMIGQDEGILTDAEKAMMRAPMLRLVRKYNLGDKMTPELEFSAALAVVILARLKRPITQSWFQARLSAVKSWWIRRKIGHAAPTPEIRHA